MIRVLPVLVLAGIPSLSFSMVTYYFQGVWSQSTQYPAGTPFTGSFSYQYPQTNPNFTWMTTWHGSRIDIQTSGYQDLSISLDNSNDSGQAWVVIETGREIFGAPIDFLNAKGGFQIGGLTFEVLTSLAPQPLNWWHELPFFEITQFQSVSIGITSNDPFLMPHEQFRAYGTAALISSVPEPTSLSLLLAGGALLMAGRRRKS